MDFSIIIPAKNEEDYIANCLDSIFQVSYPKDKYEVIVVDNGSTDRTVEIAKEKGANVFVRPDLTISGLRNFGASQGKGTLLAFLDADCTVSMDWLKNSAIYLDDKNVASFGSSAVLPEKTTWVQRAWYYIRKRDLRCQDVEWLESANVFARKDSFEKVGGFNETLLTCEDYDLSVRLSQEGKIFYDPRVVVVHHREPATIKNFFRKELWRSISNRERFLSFDFKKSEIPSLILPPIYIFLFCVFWFIFFIFGLYDGSDLNLDVLLVFFVFQIPVFLISIKKVFPSKSIIHYLQLYYLLNVYFLARGISFFSKH